MQGDWKNLQDKETQQALKKNDITDLALAEEDSPSRAGSEYRAPVQQRAWGAEETGRMLGFLGLQDWRGAERDEGRKKVQITAQCTDG